MRPTYLLCAATIALFACQTDDRTRENAAPASAAKAPTGTSSPGKPEAPVQIEADLTGSTAQVRLRFSQAASNVEVRASGARGLVVQGDGLLAGGLSVTAGQTGVFDVAFTPGPGESLLALQVRGIFAAGERTAVRAFAVGKPDAEQQRKASEGTTTIGGNRVRLMPAEEQRQ